MPKLYIGERALPSLHRRDRVTPTEATRNGSGEAYSCFLDSDIPDL